MADVNANIGVHIDTSAALAELKALQRQLATFHSSVAKNSAAAVQAQRGLQTNLLNSINATGKFHAQMGLVRSSTDSFTHALEKNKLSMREYFRYAGGSTRTFGKLFKQEFNTISKVAEERVKKMQTQYIKMGRDASGAIKSMSITPRTLDMTNYANKTAVAAQKQALLNQLLKQGSTNLLNFGKNTQWAGRQLMVGFTIPLAYFGTAAAKTFMDLEKQAIRFKRVYGDMFTTTDETNRALADVQKLAEEFTKYGIAVTETMEMAANAAAMGKTGADLTAQVAEATRLAVLGGVEQAQALETTISVTNAFGVAAEDLAKKVNFLNAVENQTVVSIEDLTIAIPKAGPVVQQLGGDVEDLAFFLTAMKEGGINASEGANALKSGLASLINPTKKASEMLAGMGINIKGIVEANKGDIKNTVIGFAQALDTLDPLNRARAIEQLFGKFQFSRLSTLFQNVTKDGTQASRVLQLAGASVEELAILSERELGVLENAIGTDFKESIEKLKLAIAPIGKEFLKAITPVAKTIGSFLEKFNNLGDGTKKFIVVATTLVGVIGPVLLMTFGLLANGVANIIKLFITMRSGFLRAGTNTQLLAQQTQYLNTEQLEAATVAASLNQTHTRLTQSFNMEATAVRLLRQAYIDATIAATNFARANPGMMMPGMGGVGGKIPKKFARGTTGLPGPKGAGDIIPVMGAPGEAIIPSETAQDDRFKPLIAALVSGNIKGYKKGSTGLGDDYSHVGGRKNLNIDEILKDPRISLLEKEKLRAYKQVLISQGKPAAISSYGSLAYSFDPRLNKGMATSNGVSIVDFEKAWTSRGANKWMASNIPPSQAQVIDDAILRQIKASGVTKVTDSIVDQAFRNLPPEIKSTPAYTKMSNLHADLGSYGIGKGLGSNPKTSEGILADAKKKGFIKDYRIETRVNSKGATVTKSLIVTNLDGSEVNLGRGSRTNRQYLKEKVAIQPGQKVRDAKTGRAVPSSTVPLTKADKAAIPSGQKLNHPKAVMVGPGKFVPSLRATAQYGFNPDGTPILTKPGMAISKVQEDFKAQQNSLRRQIEKVEQRRLAALKQELKITEDKNKIATQAAPLTKEQLKQQKNEVRAQRSAAVGRVAGPAAGLAGIGAMAGFMTGNNTLGMGMMGISALATIAPMLTNPIGLLVATIVGVVAGFKLIEKRSKDLAKKQSTYIDSISGTTDKMKKVGAITGKVGASELMARRRQDSLPDKFSQQYNRAGQQFGTNFMSSDIGKEISKGFGESLLKDRSVAIKQFALQLSSYVSDGVIDGVQAGDIARQIAVDFNDMSLYPNIIGQLTSIIGPDGVNILNDPIKVRMLIIDEQSGLSNIQAEGIVAGDRGLIGKEETGKARQAAAAASAASYSQSYELAKAQVDATNLQYQKDLEILKNKQKLATTEKEREKIQTNINTLTTKNKKDNSDLSAEMTQILIDQQAAFDKTSRSQQGLLPGQINFVRNAFLEASKQQVTTKFAGTQLEGAAKALLENTKNFESTDLEVKINAIAASGTNPTLLASLINMFKNDEAELNRQIDLAVSTKGVDATISLLGQLGMIKNDATKKQLFIDITKITDDKEFADIQSTLTKISEMAGKDFDINTYLEVNGITTLKDLTKDLNKLDKVISPITKVTQIENIGLSAEQVNAISSNWEYFMSLPETVRKTAIQTYVVALDMVTPEQINAEIAKRITAAGAVGSTVANYYNSPQGRARLTNELAMQATTPQYDPSVKGPNVPKPGGGGAGSGTKDDPFLDLLTRLKKVKDSTIDVNGGFKELQRVLAKGGGDLPEFLGINQLLRTQGITEEFIQFVGGLEAAVQKGFIEINKGTGAIKVLEKGEAAARGFAEAISGEFNDATDESVTLLEAQANQFARLVSAGYDAKTVLELINDGQVAQAIKNGETNESIDKQIERINRLKEAQQEFLEQTDPEKAFEIEMNKAMEYYNFLEKEAKAAAKPEIDRINDLIDANAKLIESKQRDIEMQYDRPIEKFNQDISIIDKAADEINKKYDQQIEALEKVSSLNEEIANQEKSRLSIASALTSGDVAAAASAVQDARAQAAASQLERQKTAIEASRAQEVAGLTVGGKTRAQIEAEIYKLEQARIPILTAIRDLEDQNYNYNKNQLEPLQNALDAKIKNIDASRTAFENEQLAIKKAGFEADKTTERFKLGIDPVKIIKGLWDAITDKNITVTATYTSGGKPLVTSGLDTGISTTGRGGGIFRNSPVAQMYGGKILPMAMGGPVPKVKYTSPPNQIKSYNKGGLIPKYMFAGGSIGSDTVPAMLTPGEFVMNKKASQEFGPLLSMLNESKYPSMMGPSYGTSGGSSRNVSIKDNSTDVYNYNVGISVGGTNVSADQIAKTVMNEIKYLDAQRVRGQRVS